MTLGASPHMAPGGLLLMQYVDATMGERHRFEMHVAHFDPSTLAYTNDGAKVPAEAGVADTYAALGALWAAYYPATWVLQLLALYYNDGGSLSLAPTQPTAVPIHGTNGAASVAGPSVRRFYICRSLAKGRRGIRFAQMPGTVIGATADVSSTGGGFDARDVALLAYLSGAASGAVCPDGFAFADHATAVLSDDRPLAPPPFDVGAQGVVPTPCLYFASHGATICNDAPDLLHFNTPHAQHALDLTGYQLPRLHRLEEYVLNQTPNPLDAPVLGTTHASSNPFPAGTYTLGYTYQTPGGETALSPTATITVDGTQWITLTTGPAPFGLGPHFVFGISVYVVDPLPAGAVGVYTGFVSDYPVDTTVNVSNDTAPDASQPPAGNQTGTWQVRVVDPHGAALLDLPLPVLDAAPATLVGRDPGSGLPAFCPTLVPTTTTVILGGGGGSLAAPPSTCVQVRCGVSAALMGHLMSLYVNWSNWLDPLFQACATLGVVVALGSVPWDWLFDLAGADAGLAIKGGIISLLQGFGSAITGNLLPNLSGDLQTQMQQAAFDTLDCAGDQVQVSAANIAAWQTALGAFTTWPLASLAGPFCGLLLQYTPLAAWQAAAVTASPSHACDAWP